MVHHEFPTGYHQDFGPERFKLAEGLFDHAMLGAGYIGNYLICPSELQTRYCLNLLTVILEIRICHIAT